jgi:hypothetical protein
MRPVSDIAPRIGAHSAGGTPRVRASSAPTVVIATRLQSPRRNQTRHA